MVRLLSVLDLYRVEDFKMYIVGERITEIKPNVCQLLLPYIKDSQPGY